MERKIEYKNLTPRQREIWRMRYKYKWRLRQIALATGTSKSNISQILSKARRAVGVPAQRDITVFRTQPRRVYAHSLSRYTNY